MTKTTKKVTKKAVLEGMITKAEVEITQQKVMIDFYEDIIAKTGNTELANAYKVKQSQMKSTLEFNEKFIDYVKSL